MRLNRLRINEALQAGNFLAKSQYRKKSKCSKQRRLDRKLLRQRSKNKLNFQEGNLMIIATVQKLQQSAFFKIQM